MSGLAFDEAAHAYTLDGERLPSVTQVLHSSGLIDFSAVPEKVLAVALARGQAVHQAIHYFNEKDLDVAEFRRNFPPYAGYLNAWINFCEQRHFRALHNEHRLCSRRYGVAGTLDCLGLLDGTPCLADFKTGNPDDVAADLQTAAYEGMAREWSSEDLQLRDFFVQVGSRPLQRIAVQLKRDGKFKVEVYKDPRDFSEFTALVTARRIVEARRGDVAAWLQGAA